MSLGVEPDKMIFALNKSDLSEPDEILTKVNTLKLNETKKWIPISSVTGENKSQLKDLINKLLEPKKTVVSKKSLKEELDKIYGT